jgi:hypothetical protein
VRRELVDALVRLYNADVLPRAWGEARWRQQHLARWRISPRHCWVSAGGMRRARIASNGRLKLAGLAQ